MAEEIVAQSRVCTKCGVEKGAVQFFKDKRRKYFPCGGLFAQCKECTSAAVKERRGRDPARFQEWERDSYARRKHLHGKSRRYRGLYYRLKSKFKISPDDFLAMLEKQNDACAICDRAITVGPEGKGSRQSACIDHDHITGRVRGLLCHGCNTAIGLFSESVAILARASQYLTERSLESSDRRGESGA